MISLMVANAVDKGLSARNIVSQSWNQTVEDGGNITYQIVTNAKEVMHVRVQLALAVTFAAGCVQVHHEKSCLIVFLLLNRPKTTRP